jgi:hypothetical protein
MRSSATLAAIALAVVLVSAGCASIQPPVLDPAVAAMEDRPAVIFVSGLTGTVLYDRETQRVTWGDARSTLLPRDRGRAMAKPIGGAEDRVEVREPILDMSLRPFYRYEVYRPIVTTLEANGFKRGRDLFLFGYDWRQSNVESARGLHAVLRDAPPPRDVRYYSIQNRSHRTIDRAMLVRDDEGWQTLFIGDRRVDMRPELEGLMATRGDLHAGVEGQTALSPGETAVLAEPLIEVDGDHLGVVRSPASHRAILRIIASSGSRSPPR